MRRLLLAAALATGLPPSSAPAAARSDGNSPLAGVWTGVRTVREKDGCRLDDAAKARRRVTLTIRTAPNGMLVGDLAAVDAPGDPPRRWSGTTEDGRVSFQAPQTMTCRGQTHRYVVRPTGRMPARAGRRGATMRLIAEDGLCGCGFDVRYELKRTAPLPQAPRSSPDPRALAGIWEGTLARVQAGRCSVGGQEKSVTAVRVIIRADAGGAVVAGFTLLPAPATNVGNVSIRVDKDRLFFDQPITAQCGPNFRRKYVVKYEIGASQAPDGRRVLTLAGIDVPCIQSGCRFQNLVQLEFKGDPPAAP